MSPARRIVRSAACILLVLAFAWTPASAAASQVDFGVEVIVADRDERGTSPELGALADRLRTQFPQFTRFRRAATHTFSLNESERHAFSVPGDSEFALTLLETTEEGVRVRIQVRGGSSTIVLPRGGMIFVGGPGASGGTLIFAVHAH